MRPRRPALTRVPLCRSRNSCSMRSLELQYWQRRVIVDFVIDSWNALRRTPKECCGGQQHHRVAPCVLLPSRKPSLPCGLRSKSFPPVVAAGRAVLPAVSHQQEAARIMCQSVCADMWAGMFDVAKEMGLQQTIPTRGRFRSACSENDSRSISEHVLRNRPRPTS
jgi:hypothetical protein